ncbi:MAG: carboxypeptidase regulatory-like domain-containing protein [Gemmataceae bacterium]|nr:carboxypeptidase regulatory-like domain-containing protein [Gemmataceae bacterium]
MKILFRLLALGLFLGLLGCGGGGGVGPRSTVKGKVTVGGKGPLTGGTIQFIPANGSYGAGVISDDGSYTVTDAPVGECKVVVDNSNLAGPSGGAPGVKMGKGKDNSKMGAAPKGAIIPGEMGGAKTASKYMKIDASFSKAETTSLKATLTRGANSVDFDVK